MRNVLNKSLNEISQDEEEEAASDHIDLKLDAVWKDIEIMGRLYPAVPADDWDALTRQHLQEFTSDEGFQAGLTRDEFLRAMGEAYDAIVAAAEEEEEEEEEEEANSPPPLITVPPTTTTPASS